MMIGLISAFVALVYLTSIVFSLRAAATARTSQGAVGWVVFLLTSPILAIPAYMFLGHHRFHGYRIARRDSEQVVAGIRAFTKQHTLPANATPICLAPFEAIARMPAIKGNGFDLLIDGEAAFEAMFAAIDAARAYVLVQFYIVRDDGLGRRMQAHLIAAARRGVKVRFLTDAVGSYFLPDSYSDVLRDGGVDVADHKKASNPKSRFQINYRNHRKSVIVDGRVGFTGGLNVGDEYLGQDLKYGAWRDTHLQLRGPVVQQFQVIFVEDWHWITDEDLLDQLNWDTEQDSRDMVSLIVATGPGDETETGSLMFFSAITAAQERIWIASPYFLPDLDVITALIHAAMRGVDVRILVPDRIDHHTPWLAAFAYFDEIRASGVRVFRYTEGFMHQKAFVVDDTLAAIGTTNLDNRSFRLNFEVMALFFDSRAAQAVEDMLRADFQRSYELTKTIDQQPWRIRYGASVARLFAPLL